MTSPFAYLDAALSAAVDQAFSETVVISPIVTGEFASAPDPSRPSRTVRGTFSSGPSSDSLGVRGQGSFSGPTLRATQSATLWIAAAERAALPYALVPGDRVSMPGRPGQIFEITMLGDTDMGDAELKLNMVTV